MNRTTLTLYSEPAPRSIQITYNGNKLETNAQGEGSLKLGDVEITYKNGTIAISGDLKVSQWIDDDGTMQVKLTSRDWLRLFGDFDGSTAALLAVGALSARRRGRLDLMDSRLYDDHSHITSFMRPHD
jgi:hypothetical protein